MGRTYAPASFETPCRLRTQQASVEKKKGGRGTEEWQQTGSMAVIVAAIAFI
jgi:hypothetical protein